MPYKQPPRRRTKLIQLSRRNVNSRYLISQYALLDTWQAVASKIGVSAAMAFRVAMQDYKPRDGTIMERIRQARLHDYDGWRQRNMGKILAIVEWAEKRV